MADLPQVYKVLRKVMLAPIGHHVVVTDTPGLLSVESEQADAKGKRAWRGGVQTKKNYVSYHLMAVYESPALLEKISPELRARMQGKSCFNFTTVGEDLFEQLGALTRTAFGE